MASVALQLIESIIQSARRAGNKYSLRMYPFSFNNLAADGLGLNEVRDVQYTLDPDTERCLVYASFCAIGDSIAGPLNLSSPTLSRLEPVFTHNGIDLLEPEAESDSGGALIRPSWLDLATSCGGVSDNGGRVNPYVTGIFPLNHIVGPGGILTLGSRKTLAPGFGETWSFSGVVHTIKL